MTLDDARQRMMNMVLGYQTIHMLREVANLGIVEILAEAPQAPDELAEATGTRAPVLARMMGDLVTRGVYDRSESGQLSLNALSNLLRRDQLGSLTPMILDIGGSHTQIAWTQLGHTLTTGEPAFLSAHGTGFWEYLDAHPEVSENFNEFMVQWSHDRH